MRRSAARRVPVVVARPVLGVLRLSTGDVLTLDRDVVLGVIPPPTSPVKTATAERTWSGFPSADGEISRARLRVSLSGWQVLVTDLNSTNGTRVTLPGRDPEQLPPGVPGAHQPRHGDRAGRGRQLPLRGCRSELNPSRRRRPPPGRRLRLSGRPGTPPRCDGLGWRRPEVGRQAGRGVVRQLDQAVRDGVGRSTLLDRPAAGPSAFLPRRGRRRRGSPSVVDCGGDGSGAGSAPSAAPSGRRQEQK